MVWSTIPYELIIVLQFYRDDVAVQDNSRIENCTDCVLKVVEEAETTFRHDLDSCSVAARLSVIRP